MMVVNSVKKEKKKSPRKIGQRPRPPLQPRHPLAVHRQQVPVEAVRLKLSSPQQIISLMKRIRGMRAMDQDRQGRDDEWTIKKNKVKPDLLPGGVVDQIANLESDMHTETPGTTRNAQTIGVTLILGESRARSERKRLGIFGDR